MTTVTVTAGSISIPNPVRTGDPFTATFTFKADNILPESFEYKVFSLRDDTKEPTLMAMATEDFLIPAFGQTKHIVCNGNLQDGCGYIFEPTLPGGTSVEFWVQVTPLADLEGYHRYYLGESVTAVDNGTPIVTMADLPTQVTPLQIVTLHVTLEARTNMVVNPEVGITQTDGPKIQYKASDNTWKDLSTTPVYTGPVVPFLSGGTGVDIDMQFRMPDAGWFDSNTGKTANICLVGARVTTDGLTHVPYPPYQCKTTFIKKSTTTCVESAERCVKSDQTLGGCIRQVCHSNSWVEVNNNDPTCPGCGTNKTCDGKPAGTIECGHPTHCSRYKCNGLTGVWDVVQEQDQTCFPNTCVPAVCNSGQSSCDPEITKGKPCVKYDCVSGQWVKSTNQGIADCGVTCAVQNPFVIGGIAAAGVVAAGLFYYFYTKKPANKSGGGGY